MRALTRQPDRLTLLRWRQATGCRARCTSGRPRDLLVGVFGVRAHCRSALAVAPEPSARYRRRVAACATVTDSASIPQRARLLCERLVERSEVVMSAETVTR